MTRVPGFGEVNWTEEELEAHAERVERTHRANRSPLTIRWRWIVPVPARRRCDCVLCLKEWPCQHMRWAEDWLANHRYRRVLAE